MATFTQALSEARRKAALSGRPLARTEAAGIAEGYAEQASERAARTKALLLQEKALSLQKKSIENARVQAEADRAAAERAAKMQTIGTMTVTGAAIGAYTGVGAGAAMGAAGGAATGAATGAASGAASGAATGAAATSWSGPGTIVGAAIGLMVGLAASSSHLCTEYTSVVNGIDRDHLRAYKRLRDFAREYYPKSFQFYLDNAPDIILGVRYAHPDPGHYREWWEQFHINIVLPMLHVTDGDTAPYLAYITHVVDILTPTYARQHAEKARELFWMDSVGYDACGPNSGVHGQEVE